MTAKVIDGKAFAAKVRAEVATHVAGLKEKGIVPGLVRGEMLKPGAALIDIGINRVADPDGTTRTVGDADFASCKDVAGWITPVPGGVGPVTVAILMKNAVLATAMQMDYYRIAFAAAV